MRPCQSVLALKMRHRPPLLVQVGLPNHPPQTLEVDQRFPTIQAQLADLRPQVRAVRRSESPEEEEPTALLDSGAAHAVLDQESVATQSLHPCTVSLAGDQKQTWRQTPGGSLVAPDNGEGSTPQTIIPLGLLVEQLGCSLRWSRKSGLQLVHPRLGRLKTSLKAGCPQLSKAQALELVRELEGARLGELDGRLKRVQAQLSVQSGVAFDEALEAFVRAVARMRW